MSVDRVGLLKNQGVPIHHQTEWVGEVGPDRHEVPLPQISSVGLNLTPEEWCAIGMRESELYIGPCCGTTGLMQDHINAAFRNSGLLDGSDLLTLGELARTHEGFETFQPMDDERFSEWMRAWAEGCLDPWDRIGLVFSGVEPWLSPRSHERARLQEDRDERQESFRLMAQTLSALEFNDLYRREGEAGEQHRLSTMLAMVRLLQPVRNLLAHLEASQLNFQGWGLVVPGSEQLLSNGYGLCIYPSREGAERVLELWDRPQPYGGDEKIEAEMVQIQVSPEQGLRVLRGERNELAPEDQ